MLRPADIVATKTGQRFVDETSPWIRLKKPITALIRIDGNPLL
jgi:hypothetical protein